MQKLFDILSPKGYVKVFTAYIEKPSAVSGQPLDSANGKPPTANIPIASLIISFYDQRATYLFGGPGDDKKFWR